MVWEFGVISFLAGLVALLIVDRFSWMNKVSKAIPDAAVLKEVGTAIVDEKIKEFGLSAPGPGGRPAEGLMGLAERFLMTPLGQQIAGALAQKFLPAGGQPGFQVGP